MGVVYFRPMAKEKVLFSLFKISTICNVLFFVALLIRYWRILPQHDLESTIVILGWGCAPLLNLVSILIFWFSSRDSAVFLRYPRGWRWSHYLFLIIQITLFLLLK